MKRESTVEMVLQGIARCIETGTTKTGRWFGREEKKVEDLEKELIICKEKIEKAKICLGQDLYFSSLFLSEFL